MRLTNLELEIMEFFWEHREPCTRGQIVDLTSETRSWKATSIHIFLNSLLRKGAIQITGYGQNAKQYGRTYAAAIDRAQYAVNRIYEISDDRKAVFQAFFDTVDGLTPQQKQDMIDLVNQKYEQDRQTGLSGKE